MSLQAFDSLIPLVHEFASRIARSVDVGREVSLAIGPGSSRGVLLRSETFAELGSASTASATIVAGTSDVSLVHDRRVRLLGRDIAEISAGETVPFGVVLLGAGEEMTAEDYERLVECQYVSDWIEGYMVRSRPGTTWARVSSDAVARGFDFAFLGSALRRVVLERVPKVQAVDVLFVTSSSEDVVTLASLAVQFRDVAHDLHRGVWSKKGVDVDCAFGGHCGACSDKETCDEVRKLSRMRTALRSEAEVA